MAGFDGIVGIDLDFIVLLRASSGNKRDNAKNGEPTKDKKKSRATNRIERREE
jgi:hypothetical protein